MPPAALGIEVPDAAVPRAQGVPGGLKISFYMPIWGSEITLYTPAEAVWAPEIGDPAI